MYVYMYIYIHTYIHTYIYPFQIPLETLGRFLRDFLFSCSGLHIAKTMEMFQFNTKPAPSKIYGKVMNIMLKKGKVSFLDNFSIAFFIL